MTNAKIQIPNQTQNPNIQKDGAGSFLDFVIWISIGIWSLTFGFSLFSFCILHCHFDFYILIFDSYHSYPSTPLGMTSFLLLWQMPPSLFKRRRLEDEFTGFLPRLFDKPIEGWAFDFSILLLKSCEGERRPGKNRTLKHIEYALYEACKKPGSLATFFQIKSQRIFLWIRHIPPPDSSVIIDDFIMTVLMFFLMVFCTVCW